MVNEKKRSLVKTITYRIGGSTVTALLVLFLTGSIIISITVGLLESLFKGIFYYIHERIWLNIEWGKDLK